MGQGGTSQSLARAHRKRAGAAVNGWERATELRTDARFFGGSPVQGFTDRPVAASRGKRTSSNRDHLHAGSKAKFAEKFFAVFPRETEGAHVGNTETSDDG